MAASLFFAVLLCVHVLGLSIDANHNAGCCKVEWPHLQARGQRRFRRSGPQLDPAMNRAALVDPVEVHRRITHLRKVNPIWSEPGLKTTRYRDGVCWQAAFTEAQTAELCNPPWNLRFTSTEEACLESKWFTTPKPDPPDLAKCAWRQGLQEITMEAPIALSVISKAVDAQAWATTDEFDSFSFFKTAGEGIAVYVLDVTNAQLDEKHYNVRPRLIRPNLWGSLASHSHAANVASVIASKVHGVAKNVQIVIVPMESRSLRFDPRNFVNAVRRILKDVMHKRSQGRAVINMSFRVELTKGQQYLGEEIERLFRKATRLGIVLVKAAGNDGPLFGAEDIISILAMTTNIPIIIVGALDRQQRRSTYSQGYLTNHVWARGELDWNGVWVAGTSFAAGRVSGLAAYFMSTVNFESKIEDRARLVKDYIIYQARREYENGPLVADNGMAAWSRARSETAVN